MATVRFRYALCAALLLMACGAITARAADPAPAYSRVTLFFLHNAWKEKMPTGDVKLGEGVLGLSVDQIVSPTFEFQLSGTYSGASLTNPDDSKADLSGINDTRFKGTYFFAERRASAALILNLPTGKKELTDEQYLVALGIADNARKYLVRRFGQGLDVGGELFWLPHSDQVKLRLGGGYLYKGSYKVRQSDADTYKFGDELYAAGAISAGSEPVSGRLSATYKLYTKDKYGDEAVYKAGPSIIVSGRLSYSKNFWASLGFTAISRGKADIAATSGGLSEETLKSGRNESLVDLSATVPMGERLRALGRLEFKNVSANDYDSTSTFFRPKANYTGIGAGVGYQFTLSLWGSIVGTYYTGTVAENHDLTGLGVTAALIFRYW